MSIAAIAQQKIVPPLNKAKMSTSTASSIAPMEEDKTDYSAVKKEDFLTYLARKKKEEQDAKDKTDAQKPFDLSANKMLAGLQCCTTNDGSTVIFDTKNQLTPLIKIHPDGKIGVRIQGAVDSPENIDAIVKGAMVLKQTRPSGETKVNAKDPEHRFLYEQAAEVAGVHVTNPMSIDEIKSVDPKLRERITHGLETKWREMGGKPETIVMNAEHAPHNSREYLDSMLRGVQTMHEKTPGKAIDLQGKNTENNRVLAEAAKLVGMEVKNAPADALDPKMKAAMAEEWRNMKGNVPEIIGEARPTGSAARTVNDLVGSDANAKLLTATVAFANAADPSLQPAVIVSAPTQKWNATMNVGSPGGMA